MMNLDGIDHAAITVSDLARSEKWYREVLGFQRQHTGVWTQPTFMVRGTTAIALFRAGRAADASTQKSGGPQFLHLAFRASAEEFKKAQAELDSLGIAFEFQDHQIAHSIYFSDPDGHRLEITTYDLL